MISGIKKQYPVHLFVILIAGFFLVLVTGDWFMRFHWFGWHKSFVTSRIQHGASGGEAEGRVFELPSSRGGDLTQLIQIKSRVRQYEQLRPSSLSSVDAWGFYNEKGSDPQTSQIIVVGDSYMNAGGSLTNYFHTRLSLMTGLSVYNRSIGGRGPILALDQFLETFSKESSGQRKILIWGLIEREIHRHTLAGSMVYDLWVKEHPEDKKTNVKAQESFSGFKFFKLSTRRLKKDLLNTSVMARLSMKVWNRVRYHILGRITPQVVESKPMADGQRMLFLGEAIEYMRWGNRGRNISQVVWSLDYLNAFCARENILLLIVLIPDKAQVYRDLIPDRLNNDVNYIPPSCLWALEDGLRMQGVHVLNLLPLFQNAAKEGDLIYWRDDTHWNPAGIRLAAKHTVPMLMDILK